MTKLHYFLDAFSNAYSGHIKFNGLWSFTDEDNAIFVSGSPKDAGLIEVSFDTYVNNSTPTNEGITL